MIMNINVFYGFILYNLITCNIFFYFEKYNKVKSCCSVGLIFLEYISEFIDLNFINLFIFMCIKCFIVQNNNFINNVLWLSAYNLVLSWIMAFMIYIIYRKEFE